jgi:mannose/cellobiose epimerase-like protein (N-acyl-D-glucosamine 2-epimerase family)
MVAHPQAMDRARKLLALMEQKFIDPETGTLGEYFTDQWARAPGADGDLVEPGHHAEWSWLLRQYERINRLPAGARASALIDKAVGWSDPATGLLVDEADRRGGIRRTTRRTWPQTELAKAWMGEAEVGRAGAADKARQALAGLAKHYLDRPVVGGWTDQFDTAGRPLSQVVMASTFYHVFCAIAEADRVLGASASATAAPASAAPSARAPR